MNSSIRPRHFWKEIITGYIDDAKKRSQDDKAMWRRLDYAERCLYHGNSAGRNNPTMDLKDDFDIEDIEAVLGVKPGAASSSAMAWRAIRAHYDAANAGAGLSL